MNKQLKMALKRIHQTMVVCSTLKERKEAMINLAKTLQE